MNNFLKYSSYLKISYTLITTLLILYSLENYIGNKFIYFIFAISVSIFFLNSFNKKNIKLFDFFLSIFIWFGFLFKFYVCINIINTFPEGVGNFDYKPSSFDEVMIISSIGIWGFLLGYYMIPKKKFSINLKLNHLENFFYKNSKVIIFLITFFIVFFSFINFKFGFFQKGFVSNQFLGNVLRNFIAFLFMIGFGTIIAFIISYSLNKKNYLIIYLPLIETFLTSFSMLSRAMIFNFFPFLIGYLIKINNHKIKKINHIKIFLFVSSLIVLILISVLSTSSLRYNKNILRTDNFIQNQNKYIVNENLNSINRVSLINQKKKQIEYKNIKKVKTEDRNFVKLSKKIYNKLIDIIMYRFIGIEGVMAVQGYKNKNFNLYFLSLKETYAENSASFYDNFILKETSTYNKSLKIIENQHAITLPGFIAHSYYTGSYIFVFFSTLIISIFCNLILTINYSLFKNIIFNSFLANLLSYRLIHWGFAPLNSYKLILGIIIAIFFIILLNHGAKKFYFKK